MYIFELYYVTHLKCDLNALFMGITCDAITYAHTAYIIVYDLTSMTFPLASIQFIKNNNWNGQRARAHARTHPIAQ